MAVKRLYLGAANKPFHKQHQDVMDKYGDGWIFIDKFTSGPEIVNADAEDLPYDNDTIDTIYASHLLEHIPFVRVPKVLRHWCLLLKTGGELVLNVPDLEWMCEWYLKLLRWERSGQEARFVNNHYRYTHNWDLPGNSFIQMFYGSQSHDGEYHQSGYSVDSLHRILKNVGFTKIDMEQKEDAHDMGVIISTARK